MKRLDIIGGFGLIGTTLKEVAYDLDIKTWGINPNSYGYFDLLDEKSWEGFFESCPKKIILLAWPGLPNYQEDFHISQNLKMSKVFLERLFKQDFEKIVIAGTCYEYGLLEGELEESIKTFPVTKYGIAKDKLRIFLEKKAKNNSFNWCWLRIFYPYKENTKRPTLYSSLKLAIKEKHDNFEIGSGSLIRDFIAVESIAKQLLELIFNENAKGIYNGGSGKPQSLCDFAIKVVKSQKSNINLNFGSQNKRDYEPKSFWADMSKYRNLLNKYPSRKFYK